ncbi:hypothetical protein T484DRAFT_1801635 [Baffinella frigidus]|nr:hypothetical protein T484DRAFT_1801635 [Cryptophyta sp. CCMP2293]
MAARAYSYASKEWVEIRAVDPETGKQEWWDGFVSSTVEGHVRAHFKGNSPSLDLSVRVDSPRIRPARDPSIMEDDDDDEDRRADATPEAVYWSDFRQAAKEMEDKQTPLKRPPAPKSKNGHVVDTFVEKKLKVTKQAKVALNLPEDVTVELETVLRNLAAGDCPVKVLRAWVARAEVLNGLGKPGSVVLAIQVEVPLKETDDCLLLARLCDPLGLELLEQVRYSSGVGSPALAVPALLREGVRAGLVRTQEAPATGN